MTFAIVIPAYNGSQFIEAAILSALNQSRPADEVIVSDDNSSDDTLEICKKYEPQIRIYKNPQGPSGYANGFNNAAARAKSDYIAILHQDDLLVPDFLYEADMALLHNSDILHLFTVCNYIDQDQQITAVSFASDESTYIKRFTGLEYVKAYQKLGKPHIHRCPGVITHRSIFNTCKYIPAAGLITDDDFFYRVGKFTDVIGILKPLASYRHHLSSATGILKDHELAERLAQDYLYQCRQWRKDPFMDKEAYKYFAANGRKFNSRCLMHGIKLKNPKMFFSGLKRYLKLIWTTAR